MSATPPPRYTQCSAKLPVSPPEYAAVILPSVGNPPGFVTPQVQTEISTNYLGNDCNLPAETEVSNSIFVAAQKSMSHRGSIGLFLLILTFVVGLSLGTRSGIWIVGGIQS